MKKRIAAFIIALVMVVSVPFNAFALGFGIDNGWTVFTDPDANDVDPVVDSGDSDDEKVVVIDDGRARSIQDIADTGSSFFIVPEAGRPMAVVTGADGLTQLEERNTQTTQSWIVNSFNGYYYFEDTNTHKVLQLSGGTAGKRTRMELGNLDGSDKQLFQIVQKKDDTFSIRPKLNTGFSFNLASNKTTAGTNVQLWKNNVTEHEFMFYPDTLGLSKLAEDASKSYYICPQVNTGCAVELSPKNTTYLWTIRPEQTNSFIVRSFEGYFYFEDEKSGKVLEVTDGTAKNGATLGLGDFDRSNKQLWIVNNEGKGYYQILSKLNKKFALDNSGNLDNNGNKICLYTANHTQAQKFKFTLNVGIPDDATDLDRYGLDEEYAIVPCHAGWAVVGAPDDGGMLIWQEYRSEPQTWTVGKKGKYYYLKNKKLNKVIEVPNGNASWSQQLGCGTYDGSDKQLWELESTNDGAYIFHSKLNYNLVWDVWEAKVDSGTKIRLDERHGGNNQRFRFMHTSTTEPMSEWGSRRHDCNVSNADVWDGSTTTEWFTDHRNDNDLYINSASDLAGLSYLVRNSNFMTGKTIHLMCDINLAGNEWRRIGTPGDHFCGSFNGHGHAIIGLSITTKDTSDGLFGVVEGGVISNLAVKGAVSGDYNVGGVVGYLDRGHLVNIYSEVRITNAADDCEGGIVGICMKGGCIEHCTQNALVNNNDQDPYRGGIVGYCKGVVRYCVNNAMVNHNWDCGGGICGYLDGGRIEYCANHGTIGGGGNSERIGGICGEMVNDGIVFGCFNDGTVYSTDDDFIGGITGLSQGRRTICCINLGRVYGDDQVGGITGDGRAYHCFNAGIVTGDDDVGAIEGRNTSDSVGCVAMSWSGANIVGNGNAGSSKWANPDAIISGQTCYDLNQDLTGYMVEGYGGDKLKDVFTQNIGSDPYPTFGSAKVERVSKPRSGMYGKVSGYYYGYANNEYQVRAEYNRDYGTVSGTGTYATSTSDEITINSGKRSSQGTSTNTSTKVTLKATPVPGCEFDHFEVKSCKVVQKKGWDDNNHDGIEEVVTTYKQDTLTLTENIEQSYTVKAVFNVFDEVPEDMRVKVKLEVECTDDAGGWNSDNLPIELIDSAGESHLWEVNRKNLDDEGEKLTHTFYIGAANPVAVYATPDFGGGLTFRSYGLKARLWVNGSGDAMESKEVIIRSWPFISSKWGSDYMSISFENYGNSKVGNAAKNEWESYTKVKDAWNKARNGKDLTIRLESAWLLEDVLELTHGQDVTLDLNGYPIIRTIKKTKDNGECIKVGGGSKLTIIDSSPKRASCGNFTGGSIQGGRSDNTAGLIECNGTLVMTGGTLYNGGTTDKGGAIKLNDNGNATLTNVLISNCWSNKAITYQNEGGAIYMRDKAKVTMKNCTIRTCKALDYGGGIYLEDDGNELKCENVNLIACKALENFGGGVHQDRGKTEWIGGTIKNCSTDDDDGGAFYQDDGEVYFENVRFEANTSSDNGGAFYCNTDDKTWFINCTFIKNRAGDNGGALYFDNNYLYMQDCSVTANSSGAKGGGLYIDSAGSIDVEGVMVIKNNDGSGSMDNLVLENGAYLYDHGLDPGSDIHLRSTDDGNVRIGNNNTSEYQLNNYFTADYGRLTLTDTQDVDTQLRASVFSEGKTVVIIGSVLLILISVGTLYYVKKRKKGGALEDEK